MTSSTLASLLWTENSELYSIEHLKIASLGRKLKLFDQIIITKIHYSESIFKLLHVFGGILDRKMIAEELHEKLPKLLDILNKELHVIDEIIKTQQRKIHDFGTPIIDRNMPKVSGQISFAKELKQKLEKTVLVIQFCKFRDQ